jgi:hypothetical protein
MSLTTMTYRLPARTGILLRGRPRTTLYVSIVWLSFVAFVGIVLVVPNAAYSRMLLGALMAVVVLALLAIRRAANRVRWSIVFDQLTLRIERVGSRGAEFAALDVAQGVRIAISVADSHASIDPCIVLETTDARVELPAGRRPGDVVHDLVAFLRENDVAVTLDPDLPLSASGYEHPMWPG